MRKSKKLLNAWNDYQQAKDILYQKRKEYIKEYLKCVSKKVSACTEQEWEEFATIANGITFDNLNERDRDFSPKE